MNGELTCYSHPGVEGMVAGGLLMQLRGNRLARGRVQTAGVPGRREGPRGGVVARTRGRVAAYEAAVATDPRALRSARGRTDDRIALAVRPRGR